MKAHPRRAAGARGIVVQPYRGYGSGDGVFLMGRVFRQPGSRPHTRRGMLRRDLADVIRLLLRRGIGGAVLAVRFDRAEQRVTTDRNGYFRVHMRLKHPPPSDQLWHSLDLELLRPAIGVKARGEFFVPPGAARYVVISDIDDTVMDTGVARKLRAFWRLFMQGARSRMAFPGVAALYRAMHHGVSGEELNPMLYVSKAPWSIYEMLDEFFRLHRIPVGPILFLREWGLTLHHPLPHRAKGHKLEMIRTMLSLYDDLPFVLVGDSGQRGPEIYAQLVRENPRRIAAVYIRNVSRNPRRIREIEGLAREVLGAASSLVLASDTFVMAEHAAEHGLISPDALLDVLQERTEQQGAPDLKPTRNVKRETYRETRNAVEHGELKEKLQEPTAENVPANVVVEPEQERRKEDTARRSS